MLLNKNMCKEYKNYPEKIIQFGEGNFLRGFVDDFIDQLNTANYYNGSIVVVQPRDKNGVDHLNEQDGLYTLYIEGIMHGEKIQEKRIINSISRGINPYRSYTEFIALGENPALEVIFSNTTEAGIVYEAAASYKTICPKSFPAKLTALLYKRYQFFGGQSKKGIYIIPCELIENNGDKLKEIVLKHAVDWELEAEFIEWVNRENIFCNTLVDRIVPGFPSERAEKIFQELGYEDKFLVVGEKFHLFVIEGDEVLKKLLPFDQIGLNIKIVEDVSEYRTLKVRVLNGAHTAMAAVAYLCGIDTVSGSMNDGQVYQYIHKLLFQEVLPTLTLSSAETESFAYSVEERFKNPYIKHNLMSISLNALAKFKTRLLPTIIDYKKRYGIYPKKVLFSLAALIVFYKGELNNSVIELNDTIENIAFFKKIWSVNGDIQTKIKYIVDQVLGSDIVLDLPLIDKNELRELLVEYLICIEQEGMREALEKYNRV